MFTGRVHRTLRQSRSDNDGRRIRSDRCDGHTASPLDWTKAPPPAQIAMLFGLFMVLPLATPIAEEIAWRGVALARLLAQRPDRGRPRTRTSRAASSGPTDRSAFSATLLPMALFVGQQLLARFL